MRTNRITVKGPASPEVVAAITAALLAARTERKPPDTTSRWAERNRPGKPWHQNDRSNWQRGLRG